MPMPLALRAVLFWFLLFVLATLNGILREFVLRPWIGPTAQPVSSLTLVALLAVAIFIFVRANAPLSMAQAWLLGAAWLVLTLGAETLIGMKFGRPASAVIATLSWSAIAGGNWVALSYVFVALAPPIFTSLRRR
jgi:hypothetical protein